MILQYRTLCTLSVQHEYYQDVCPLFDLLVPAESTTLANRGRLLLKRLKGALHVLYEADETGAPIVPLSTGRLRIGVRVVQSVFANITDVPAAFADGFARYAQAGSALAAPARAALTGPVFSHPLSLALRPVTLRVYDESGALHESVTRAALDTREDVSLDVSVLGPGVLRVEEDYGAGNTVNVSYYVHAELRAASAIAAVDIDLSPDFLVAPPAFELSFKARKQALNYYFVVDNFSDAELATLELVDGDDTRALSFSRILDSAFGGSELSLALLRSGDTRVVLFRSNDELPRQELPRKKLQLRRNGEVMIQHLPQPSADRPDTNLIIHISK